MTDIPERAARAFESHEAFERTDDGFAVTTTTFEAVATAEETDDWALRYTLVVRVPMLSTAVTDGPVGDAVEEGWFDTLSLRAEDAPMAVRADVDLASFDVESVDGEAVVTYGFEWGNADRAPDILKAFAEYVEGTYVEGVVPGFEYAEPVAGLLSRASDGESREGSGATPL